MKRNDCVLILKFNLKKQWNKEFRIEKKNAVFRQYFFLMHQCSSISVGRVPGQMNCVFSYGCTQKTIRINEKII